MQTTTRHMRKQHSIGLDKFRTFCSALKDLSHACAIFVFTGIALYAVITGDEGVLLAIKSFLTKLL